MTRSIENHEALADLTPRFISFEGTEGVGKSTNIQFVADLLKSLDQEVVLTREPGGTPMAEALRHMLLNKFDEATLPDTEILLLYAGRIQHVKHVILPALKAGKWVLCDRFFDATFAYQGGGRHTDLSRIEALNHWALGDFAPNNTFILDAPVDIGLKRIQARAQLDRFEIEKVEFFNRVRSVYLSLAKKNPNRYSVIDASQSIDKVQAHLRQQITQLVSQIQVDG